MKKKMAGAVIATLLLSSNAMAEFETSSVYVGGSAAVNRLGEKNAYGFQGFVGYDFKDDVEIGDNITMASELGYAYSGEWDSFDNFDTKGIWLAAVFSIELSDELSIINRLGYTFTDNDADGLLTGLGLDYDVDDNFTMRGEIVMQEFKSFQFGALYRF